MPRKGVTGSGGFVRPTNFTEAEARVLWKNAILVPPAWHLPHGWNVLGLGFRKLCKTRASLRQNQ
jgi:hypothetical protein